jgi:hypothetical protein
MRKKRPIDPSTLECEIQEVDDGRLQDVHAGATNWWKCTNPDDCTDSSNIIGCTNEDLCLYEN